MNISNWLKGSLTPDLHLKGYLKRWWVVPRNYWFNVYLHNFIGSDDDRALHDHPWWSLSFNLWGHLEEVIEDTERGWKWVDGFTGVSFRRIVPFWPYLRRPNHMHRMVLKSKSAWTIFITGPKSRDWGFRVPGVQVDGIKDWLPHNDFIALYGDRDCK